MGRPRKWDSDAERMAAARARQREEVAERITGKLPSPVTEEQYVEACMKLPTIVGSDGYEAARQRQEAYARWRWSAWRHGEVSGL